MVKLDTKGYRIAAWVGSALLAAWTLGSGLVGEWGKAGFMAVFLVPAIAFLLWKERLPSLFGLLFVLAALINAGGWAWDLYYTIGWYDEVAHAYTSFAVALAVAFLVYYEVQQDFRDHFVVFALSVVAFGIAIGALWEVFEWVVGALDGLDDTINDLVMDSIGSILAGLFSTWAIRNLPEKQLAQTPER